MEKDKLILSLLVILLIFFIGTSVYLYNNPSNEETEFFNDYIIAVNNINSAIYGMKIAEINLNNVIGYIEGGEYYYEDATRLTTSVGQILSEEIELLKKAKNKLNSIKGESPNEFYSNEIELRRSQIDRTLELIDKMNSYNELIDKELYEINYGTESKAKEYYDQRVILTEEYTDIVASYNNENNEIDIYWNENWYPN